MKSKRSLGSVGGHAGPGVDNAEAFLEACTQQNRLPTRFSELTMATIGCLESLAREICRNRLCTEGTNSILTMHLFCVIVSNVMRNMRLHFLILYRTQTSDLVQD